jgi:hypothetical protein
VPTRHVVKTPAAKCADKIPIGFIVFSKRWSENDINQIVGTLNSEAELSI